MLEQPTLKIVQYNIRRELGTMTSLLIDPATQEVDVFAIQEPCYIKHNRSSYNPSASVYHLAHRSGEDTRVYFYINKKLDQDR